MYSFHQVGAAAGYVRRAEEIFSNKREREKDLFEKIADTLSRPFRILSRFSRRNSR